MGNQLALINFLEKWNIVMSYLSLTSVIIGIGLFVYHRWKLDRPQKFKNVYDYIAQKELKIHHRFILSWGMALFFFSNTLAEGWVLQGLSFFFLRFCVASLLASILVFAAYSILNYYYPLYQQRQLIYWRYRPRICPITGNIMRLLSEVEEDVYLDKEAWDGENTFSVDHDVWMEDETGKICIEKYSGFVEASICEKCSMQTSKVFQEEIISPTTAFSKGELLKHHECSNCKARKTTVHTIRYTKESITVFQARLERPLFQTPNTAKLPHMNYYH